MIKHKRQGKQRTIVPGIDEENLLSNASERLKEEDGKPRANHGEKKLEIMGASRTNIRERTVAVRLG
jgi:hypothetical protein